MIIQEHFSIGLQGWAILLGGECFCSNASGHEFDLVVGMFMGTFSLFCLFKKNSFQCLAKECAQSNGKLVLGT